MPLRLANSNPERLSQTQLGCRAEKVKLWDHIFILEGIKNNSMDIKFELLFDS